VNDNFRALRQSLDLSVPEIVALARNSFVSSMMPAGEKERALADFDRVAKG